MDNILRLHLEALCISGEPGWELCKDALTTGWISEYFTASVLTFENGDESRIIEVLEHASGHEEADVYKATASALGWLAYEKAETFIQRFLGSPQPEQKYIGICFVSALTTFLTLLAYCATSLPYPDPTDELLALQAADQQFYTDWMSWAVWLFIVSLSLLLYQVLKRRRQNG
jgi:hypothetical protein